MAATSQIPETADDADGRSMSALRRWSVTFLGVVLLWAALGFTAYAVAWQSHKNHAQAVLLRSEHGVIAKTAAQSHGTPCAVDGPQSGQLSGILSIPALKLSAPVEEGTDDAELDVAVGHDPQSVWPGVSGASVLLAHDVSYFVHLNLLKPGDVITYQTACTTSKFVVSGAQIVAADSSVANTSDATLILDTCYPPDALFYTPQRLLVRADVVSTSTTGSNAVTGAAAAEAPPAPMYTTTVPSGLVAQGLTLAQNEAPMGTMQLVNSTTAFAQSPGPRPTSAACTRERSARLGGGTRWPPASHCRPS